MSFEGLHETVIKDVIDVIKDGISQAEDMGVSIRKSNSLAKSSSLNKATEGLVLVFPTLCTESVQVETMSMLSKAVERKAISILQIAFSAFSITNSDDAVSFVRQFHNNIGSGKMSIDKFIDAMDSMPTNESATTINGIDRRLLRSVLEEFKRMECYFEEDLSESSINDYKVINRFGSYVVTEKGGATIRTGPNIDKKRFEAEKLKYEKDRFEHQKKLDGSDEEIEAKRALEKERLSTQIDKDKTGIERDKVAMQKDNVGMQKDMVGMAKDDFDMLKTQILPSDVKKANEMVPSMMIINFVARDEKLGVVVPRNAIIGVKSKLYKVSSNDVINKIIVKNADSNVFLKLMRVSTRELNFVKDFLLAIDDAKLAAVSGSIKGSETNKLLKVLERRALKGKVRRRLNMNNAYKAISTLIISKEEADYIRKYNNIDVYNSAVIRKIMESLNLMMFMIADDSEESVSIIMDTGEDVYETISYTYLEREAADGSYKKAINLMTKVVR